MHRWEDFSSIFELQIVTLVILYPILANCAEIHSGNGKKTITIGGFLPMDQNHWDASDTLPALKMAIQDINRRSDVLPQHILRLEWTNSKVN